MSYKSTGLVEKTDPDKHGVIFYLPNDVVASIKAQLRAQKVACSKHYMNGVLRRVAVDLLIDWNNKGAKAYWKPRGKKRRATKRPVETGGASE